MKPDEVTGDAEAQLGSGRVPVADASKVSSEITISVGILNTEPCWLLISSRCVLAMVGGPMQRSQKSSQILSVHSGLRIKR